MNRSIFLALLFPSVFFLGCGAGVLPVGGKVTIDGEPLPGAQVLFEPKEGGRSVIGVTDESGSYQLQYTGDQQGCVPGEYVVRISTAAHQPIGPDGDPVISPERVAAEFNKNSKLTTTVESGKSSYDFQVSSK